MVKPTEYADYCWLLQAVADYDLPPRRWLAKYGAPMMDAYSNRRGKVGQLWSDYIDTREEKEVQVKKYLARSEDKATHDPRMDVIYFSNA